MIQKNDRRSLKTRKAIKDAFIQLLGKKALQEITVTELAELSDVNRATFYNHYENVRDVLNDIEEDMLNDLKAIMNDQSILSYSDFYSSMMDYVAENIKICNLLFVADGTDNANLIFKTVSEYFIESCKNTWKKEYGVKEITPCLEYFAYYRVSGIMAIVANWIKTGMSMDLKDVKSLISELDKTVDEHMLDI